MTKRSQMLSNSQATYCVFQLSAILWLTHGLSMHMSESKFFICKVSHRGKYQILFQALKGNQMATRWYGR